MNKVTVTATTTTICINLDTFHFDYGTIDQKWLTHSSNWWWYRSVRAISMLGDKTTTQAASFARSNIQTKSQWMTDNNMQNANASMASIYSLTHFFRECGLSFGFGVDISLISAYILMLNFSFVHSILISPSIFRNVWNLMDLISG